MLSGPWPIPHITPISEPDISGSIENENENEIHPPSFGSSFSSISNPDLSCVGVERDAMAGKEEEGFETMSELESLPSVRRKESARLRMPGRYPSGSSSACS